MEARGVFINHSNDSNDSNDGNGNWLLSRAALAAGGSSEKGEVLLRGETIISLSLSLYLSIYVYIHTYIYIYTCTYYVLLWGVGTLRYLLVLSENPACQAPICAVEA